MRRLPEQGINQRSSKKIHSDGEEGSQSVYTNEQSSQSKIQMVKLHHQWNSPFSSSIRFEHPRWVCGKALKVVSCWASGGLLLRNISHERLDWDIYGLSGIPGCGPGSFSMACYEPGCTAGGKWWASE